MKKILYIAGYGRSGSTALDIKLSDIDSFVGLGELAELPIDYEHDVLVCSCNKKYPECEVWGKVTPQMLKKLKVAIEDKDDFRKIFSFQSGDYSQYYNANNDVISILNEFYKNKVIIDSSKTAWRTAYRPINLYRSGFDVKVVHLIRPLKHVLASVHKGTNKALQKASKEKKFRKSRALISWFVANYFAYLCRWLVGKDRYLVVSQIDFKNSPEEVVKKICEFTDVEYKKTTTKTLHTIGGNRLKRT